MTPRSAWTVIETQLIRMMVLRVVVVTAVLGSAVTADVVTSTTGAIHPLYFLVAFTYFVTLLYAFLWRFTASFRRALAYTEILVDLIIITLVVYLTGGIDSNFAVLYFLSIIAGSIILYRKGGLVAAATASFLFGLLVELQYLGVLHKLARWEYRYVPQLPYQVVYYRIALNGFGFFTVALLTSYLSESLRKTGRELERTSDHLADLQAFNQTVIGSLTSGLMTTDLDGRVNFFNSSAENIFGLSAARAVGKTLPELLNERPDFMERVTSVLEGRRYFRMDGAYLNSRGEEIYLGMNISYLLFRGERRSGFLITFQDLTEIRRLEREVQLKENLATMGEMAAVLAHEIRNPLASISGSVQVLKEDLGLQGENSRLMNIIVRESERLSATLSEFLNYARPPRFEPQSVDLRLVVEETIALLKHSAEVRHEHQIVLTLPENAIQLFVDPNQVKQIAWNLARNAIQAMPEGGRLEVELYRNGTGEVVMAFRDEGVGIRNGDVHQVFKPFAGSFERGTGLGLAIVHRIVQDYHGEIRVDSRTPRGTEVSVRFPLARRTFLEPNPRR